MRSTSLVLAAVAGIAVGAFATQAGAITGTSSTGVRVAVATIDTAETVHCRPYRHRHPWGWGRGCGRGEVEIGVGVRRHGVVEERRGRSETRTGTGNTASGSQKRGGSKGGQGSTGQSPTGQPSGGGQPSR